MKSFRKSGVLFLLIALALSGLCGCKKEIGSINVKQEDLDVNQSYFRKRRVAKAENGYYFLGGKGRRYILYFDAQTQKTIPLCSKAQCSHNDKACMAYIGDTIWENGNALICYYGGKLYWLAESGSMVQLAECGADGSGRKVTGDLFAAKENAEEFVFCSNYVYFSDNAGHAIDDTEKVSALKRMSLQDKKVETVYEYKGKNAVIMNLRAYSDEVYFTIAAVEQTGENEFVKSGKGLYASNAASNETRVVVNDNIHSYCLDTKNGYLYYYVYNDGLYRVQDKAKELVYKATDETGYCDLIFDGQYVYMDNEMLEGHSKRLLKKEDVIQTKIWVYENGVLKTTIDAEAEQMVGLLNGDEEYFFTWKNPGYKLSCFSKKEFFETGKIEWLDAIDELEGQEDDE